MVHAEFKHAGKTELVLESIFDNVAKAFFMTLYSEKTLKFNPEHFNIESYIAINKDSWEPYVQGSKSSIIR